MTEKTQEGNYTSSVRKILLEARRNASLLGAPATGSEHVLLALAASDTLAAHVLQNAGYSAERIRAALADLLKETESPAPDTVPTRLQEFTPLCSLLLEDACALAQDMGDPSAGSEHLLTAILQEGECLATRILRGMGADPLELQEALGEGMGDDRYSFEEVLGTPVPGTDTLREFTRDLTGMAASGKLDPVLGRPREQERLIQILSRKSKNNPCLIGEPGVGKTAIVEALAQRIAAGNVPPSLENKRLLQLDLSAIVAGTKYRGEFEERMKNLLDETYAHPEILLFIDELHTLIGAGSAEGTLDAANILKPALSRGEVQIIGATTLSEYRKHIEKDTALKRRFQSILIEEPSVEETAGILAGRRALYERHHNVTISDAALRAAAELSRRYITDRCLPDKALDLLDEACAMVHLEGSPDAA
ncbi:MAG: ATP-dependent Clp protease ATP-binding subunit, partial [Lachnospiraceae bacterium]|nr:ATP-dependent Clp protease ATP-binding subunit [Lachnospiraceae bacterium]